jgi:hypothetical protein
MRCYPTLPTGIERTSVAPIWNPVIISQLISANASETTTIAIPATKDGLPVEDFDIRITALAGAASVKLNDATFTPPLLVGPGLTGVPVVASTLGVVNRAVETILVTTTAASSKIQVDVIKK